MKEWELKRRVVEAFGDTVTNFVSRGDETLLLVEVMNQLPLGSFWAADWKSE